MSAPEPAPPAPAAPTAGEVVTIGPMRRRHLRSVLRIERHTPGHGWSLGLFMSELSRREGRVYLVAKVGGEVVGFAGALVPGDEAHVTTVAVDPAWRGRAVATRMVAELVRRARALGATAVTLEVRASNEAALALYRRFGLAPVGVRAGYYSDPREDALIMWAEELGSAGYEARLAAVEASLPGATVVEEVGW